MGTPPHPPVPPAPPAAPRRSSAPVTIALLLLALIVVASGLAIYIGLQILSRNVAVRVDEGKSGAKEVSIQTPLGSLDVAGEVSEARLGLPIYPGAKRVKDKESATITFALPNDQNLRILAAKFETADRLEKVRDFYQQRLGKTAARAAAKSPHGEAVFEVKENGDKKIVALKSLAGGTEIRLVRVAHDRGETN